MLEGIGGVVRFNKHATDDKVLERGDDWQCPSTEERERARNEIHNIILQTPNSNLNVIQCKSLHRPVLMES